MVEPDENRESDMLEYELYKGWLVAAIALLLLAVVGLIVGALLPVPGWIFYASLVLVCTLALVAGVLGFLDSRASGRSFLGSLWGATRAIFGFFFSFTF